MCPANRSEPGSTYMAEDRQHGLSRRAHWAGGDKLISRLMAEALARPDLVSLAAGFVDQNYPANRGYSAGTCRVVVAARRARAALQYGTTIGHLPLREAIVARMAAADGAAGFRPAASLDQVVVTAGSNQLLHLVADTLLDPGDIVLCAAPSYFVFMATLANVGARTVGVEIDSDGMIPEALEQELATAEGGRGTAARESRLCHHLLRQSDGHHHHAGPAASVARDRAAVVAARARFT